jgi:hypothetical protein
LGYRLGHSIFHTLYCRLHRRYYNHSVTNGSLTGCVDCSHFPSTISVGADYSPSTLANYSLGSRWLTRQTNCSATTTTTRVAVGIQPKVAFVGPDRSHLAQPFRYALSRVGCLGNVCCPFTMHSSGFILGLANRYHGYNIVSLRRCVAVTVYPAVG